MLERRNASLLAHALYALPLALALFGCFEEPPKPPPLPPPDPTLTDKERNALAAPVIPKAGSGYKLKAPVVQRAPDLQAQVGAELPAPKAAKTVVAAKAPEPEPAIDPNTLIAAELPGSKFPKKQVAARPILDKEDLAAFAAPDLPIPSGAGLPPSAAGKPAPTTAASSGAALAPGEAAPAKPAWIISNKGVGNLRANRKLTLSGEVSDKYQTSFYSDAQPLEGFKLDEPPVFVAVKGGPFAEWGEDHPGEKVIPEVVQHASDLARGGDLRVHMLIVTDPAPKTDRGIGVGDSYATFARAYPTAGTPTRFPTLWEDPTCVITQQKVWFFFDRCDESAKTKIIRIVVR